MGYEIFVFLLCLSSNVLADDAVKNHRLEKRQDDSYLFFGGWRPVKSGSQVYQTAATGRYHDLLSALPGNFDHSAKYYTHALPAASNYYKDIYSYYPRPAIKSTPKKNTPVYMERFKPRRQQPKQGGKGSISAGSPQFIDIQKFELKHLQDLQNVLLQAKELPLTKLNLPNAGGKPYEVIELAVQPLQQNSYSTGSKNANRYHRNRGSQRNNKQSRRRVPQSVTPGQLPLQYQYFSVPKIKSLIPQIFPKQLSYAPIKIPQHVPAVDDILGIKNIQVVEVPVPAGAPGKHGGASQYGQRNNAYSQQQYRVPSHKTVQKIEFTPNTYYAHNTEQPRNHYPAPVPAKSSYGSQQMPQIEAELVKLTEDDVNELLKNLQVVHKNSHDLLKYLPLTEENHKPKTEQIQLVFALPQGNQEKNIEALYETKNQGGDANYGANEPYVAIPQDVAYPSQDAASISYNSGGYQVSGQTQHDEHTASGYQLEEQGGNPYEQYQTLDGKAGYIQRPYEESRTENQESGYAQGGYDTPAKQQGVHQEQQYLEIISPPQDSGGYRREPVLAVEIQKGQTIEDAIKAIDPETLQRLGAHGKDGLEIELVEVPVEEYSAESKKAETYVPSSNTTTTKAISRTTTAAPVSKDNSKVTEKKS